MRNYIGFYIILIIVILLIVFSNYAFYLLENNILEKFYDLKYNNETAEVFETIKADYQKLQPFLMLISNHSNFKEISKYFIRIENDIEFGYDFNLQNDIDELILCIEEILDAEKCNFSNIF